jgi:hypothetical protein
VPSADVKGAAVWRGNLSSGETVFEAPSAAVNITITTNHTGISTCLKLLLAFGSTLPLFNCLRMKFFFLKVAQE